MHAKHKSLISVVEKNYPINNCMFKINIKNTRTRCEICSKLTIKTPQLFCIVDFEHVFVCWVITLIFIVWVIFIILIIFIVLWFAEKLEFGVHSEISLGGESHINFRTQCVIMTLAGGGCFEIIAHVLLFASLIII